MGASWSLDTGRVAEFRLIEVTDGADCVHPFRAFQRRRGGRVGQCFRAVFVEHANVRTTYDDELQLMGWADTSGSSGRTVKFWLDEEADRHPFAGYDKRTTSKPGSLFSMLLVQLADNGHPVDQADQAAAEGAGRTRGKQKLSSAAHLIITQPLFVQFCAETFPKTPRGGWTPETTKRFVKWRLGIESLSDLDRDEAKAQDFHSVFRKPYLAWRGFDE